MDHPEEVQCSGLPHLGLQETGCKWVKRKLEGDVTDTVVANGSLLNLYRPEFHSGGIYVCIVECNIRGQPCPVEALTITYEPTGANRDARWLFKNTGHHCQSHSAYMTPEPKLACLT